jgi:hypothetical protein
LFNRLILKENQHRKKCPAFAPLYPTSTSNVYFLSKNKFMYYILFFMIMILSCFFSKFCCFSKDKVYFLNIILVVKILK